MARTPPPLRRLLSSVPPQLLLAGAVAAAALVSVLVRNAAPAFTAPAPPAPTGAGADSAVTDDGPDRLSETVEEAFEAAKKGDLDGYLAHFADPLKTQLIRTRQEKGDPYLRDYLRRSTAGVKGLAIDLTRKQETGPDAVLLPVEFVYRDRNEVQPFTLTRDGDRWRISRIETVRSTATLIPYGTPVQNVR